MTGLRGWRGAGGMAVAVLAVVAAACGSSTPSASTSTTGGSTSSTAATTTSTEAPTSSTASGGGGGSSGAGTITSVVFKGPSSNPTITVTGTGLGQLPSPNPTYTPEGHQLCPLPPAGNQGYDYGTSFYLFDSTRNFAGGRYRPELNELDCIGLLPSKFSATEVVFQFGSGYTNYYPKDYNLAEGDSYQMVVNGATMTGTVHYTG